MHQKQHGTEHRLHQHNRIRHSAPLMMMPETSKGNRLGISAFNSKQLQRVFAFTKKRPAAKRVPTSQDRVKVEQRFGGQSTPRGDPWKVRGPICAC
jgi:hypothetical protein